MRAGNSAALVDLLAPLDERARRALADRVYAMYRAAARGQPVELPADDGTDDPSLGDRVRDALATPLPGPLPGGSAISDTLYSEAIAGLAVLGCCRLDKVRRIRFYDVHRGREHIVRVLRDRKPEWASAWLEHCLDARDFPLVDWSVARTLINDGICAVPQTAGYVRAMVTALSLWWPQQGTPYVPISAQLRANADLLTTALWKLFEVDTTAFASDWRQRMPNLPDTHESWPEALLTLARDDTLERARMLDAALDAPWKFDNTNAQSNVCRFFTALEPSIVELGVRSEKLLALLRHRHSAVVGFALERLKPMLQANGITLAQVLPRLSPVFDLRQKKQPLAALKLLQPVERLLPEHADAVLGVLAAALPHPAKDVQAAAIALLLRCRPSATDGVDVLFTRFAEDLPPSLRAELAAAQGADVLTSDDASTNVGDDFTEPTTAPASILDARPCATAEPIVPIVDVQALIDLAAHLVEKVDGPADIERLLDGISRLCDQRPDDFDVRISALAKRLRARRTGTLDHGVLAWGAPPELEHLLAAWLGRTTPMLGRSSFYWVRWHGAGRSLRRRLQALIARVGNRMAAPLLSAATHEGGWVHPMALVTRLRELQTRKLTVPDEDLELALLRLAPDDRTLALATASDITGIPGRVLRFALGGDERPGSADRTQSPWWVAAAHARNPRGERSAWLAPLRLPRDWPGLQQAATLHWQSSMRTQERYRNGPALDVPHLELRWSPPLPEHRVVPARDYRWYFGLSSATRWLRDTVLDALGSARRLALRTYDRQRSGQWGGFLAFTAVTQHEPSSVHVPWCIELLGWTTPLGLDAHFAEGANAMLLQVDVDAGNGEPRAPWITRLLAQETPLDEPALLALGVALVSRSTVTRGIATEVLIRAVDDDRAAAQPLGGDNVRPSLPAVLARLADGAWFKRNRLAAAFTEVIRVSPMHAMFVARVIEGFLTRRGKVLHEDLPLLEHLVEVRVDTRTSPHAALLPLLGAVSGNSKTARAAKQLAGMVKDAKGKDRDG